MVSDKYFTVIKVAIILFLLVVFGYKTFVMLDPDLGWHLRAGEIVDTLGTAPVNDPWTYTMTGHKWVDHEWLGDWIIWKAHENGGWLPVQIFFTLLIVIPLGHMVWRARYFLELAFIGAASHLMLSIAGVRFQILSIFFFYLFYLALYPLRTKKSKWLYAVPVLFAVWANLHGGFVVALGLWSLVIVIHAFETYRATKKINSLKSHTAEVVALLLSYLATLLTPYGTGLWIEIYEGTASSSIKYIQEWTPGLMFTGPILATYFGAGGALIGFFIHSLDKKKTIPALMFLCSFLQHVRMAPFFFITTIPLIATTCDMLYAKMRETGQRMTMIRMDMVGGTALLLVYYFLGAQMLVPRTPYVDAIKALNTPMIKSVPGNIFNDYTLGGWMIYDDPTRKVFIDGRGPHWMDESGYSAFEEYMDIYTGTSTWRASFATHNINVAILGLDTPATDNDDSIIPKQLLDFLKKTLLPPTQISVTNELRNDGWCTVYQDTDATILIRPGYALCDKPI